MAAMLTQKQIATLKQQIIERISDGVALVRILREAKERGEAVPSRATVWDWAQRDEEFGRQFARARQAGCHAMIDDANDIADDRGDDPASRKIRIEARWKAAACWLPEQYGTKARLEHTGRDGGPVQTETRLDVSKLSTEALREIMAARDGTKEGGK